MINKNDEEIFVGSPTYNSSYDVRYSTGYQVTSFCDSFLPDYCFGKVSVLNPIFILGKFTVFPDNII